MIALPLGVLQSGVVAISPSPAAASDAIAALAMGSATRITLVFSRAVLGDGGEGDEFFVCLIGAGFGVVEFGSGCFAFFDGLDRWAARGDWTCG